MELFIQDVYLFTIGCIWFHLQCSLHKFVGESQKPKLMVVSSFPAVTSLCICPSLLSFNTHDVYSYPFLFLLQYRSRSVIKLLFLLVLLEDAVRVSYLEEKQDTDINLWNPWWNYTRHEGRWRRSLSPSGKPSFSFSASSSLLKTSNVSVCTASSAKIIFNSLLMRDRQSKIWLTWYRLCHDSWHCSFTSFRLRK